MKVKLLNTSERCFHIHDETLCPNKELDVDKETAERLSYLYPGELQIVGNSEEMPETEVSTESSEPDDKDDEKTEEPEAEDKSRKTIFGF